MNLIVQNTKSWHSCISIRACAHCITTYQCSMQAWLILLTLNLKSNLFLTQWKSMASCFLKSRLYKDHNNYVSFIFRLLTLVAAYFIGGFIFLKCYMKKVGREAIPHHEFWIDLPLKIRVLEFVFYKLFSKKALL